VIAGGCTDNHTIDFGVRGHGAEIRDVLAGGCQSGELGSDLGINIDDISELQTRVRIDVLEMDGSNTAETD